MYAIQCEMRENLSKMQARALDKLNHIKVFESSIIQGNSKVENFHAFHEIELIMYVPVAILLASVGRLCSL